MARSLNRVQLIGNLTRDPELRYTPNGNAVVTFGLATNRGWTTDAGEKREEVDFHRIVAWNKLAELCSQFLTKGRKVYVEGRLSTRNWTGQDGAQKSTTEVVIDDMILLDNQRQGAGAGEEAPAQAAPPRPKPAPKKREEASEDAPHPGSQQEEEVAPDDIPF
jgi:single-strand DNA-binding protein